MEVNEFNDVESVEVNFASHANFIIGRNGSGKTTFMRLLYAMLTISGKELQASPFRSCMISFNDLESKRTPQLRVQKEYPNGKVAVLSFRHSGNEPWTEYEMSEDDSSPGLFNIRSFPTKASRYDSKSLTSLALRRHISEHLALSWLPLSRVVSSTSTRQQVYFEEPRIDPVDEKISDLGRQITSYLSKLDSEVEERNRQFIREVFLSLLQPISIENVKLTSGGSSGFTELFEMYNQLGFHDDEVFERIREYLKEVNAAMTTISDSISHAKPESASTTTESSLSIDTLYRIIQHTSVITIVDLYKRFNEARDEIFRNRDQFIEILNTMLFRKHVGINEGNSVFFSILGSDVESPLKNLSSGEKQLFIIMAEALIHSGTPNVYVADEPELSLHVEWQEQLVNNIFKLNPNTQIIFATHSPDIVGSHRKNVVDFERI